MFKTVYIYGLRLKTTGQFHYVGKTNNLRYRWWGHRKEFKAWLKGKKYSQIPFYAWATRHLESMDDLEMIELEACPENIWQERERHWIARFREQGQPLENIYAGGLPPFIKHSGIGYKKKTISPEHAAKVSIATKGQTRTPEQRRHISEGKRGKPVPKLRKPKSEAHRQAISKGRKQMFRERPELLEQTRALALRASQVAAEKHKKGDK